MRFRFPKNFDETGAPNDCGLVAAAALTYLKKNGVRAKSLYIGTGRDDGHAVVVYKYAGLMHTYDSSGSLTFTPDANWRTDPMLMAKAYMKHYKKRKKVIKAYYKPK